MTQRLLKELRNIRLVAEHKAHAAKDRHELCESEFYRGEMGLCDRIITLIENELTDPIEVDDDFFERLGNGG